MCGLSGRVLYIFFLFIDLYSLAYVFCELYIKKNYVLLLLEVYTADKLTAHLLENSYYCRWMFGSKMLQTCQYLTQVYKKMRDRYE